MHKNCIWYNTNMKVIKIIPRSYCHGVVEAINFVVSATLDPSVPRPLYLLGELVHNKNITNVLKNAGVITLEQKNKTRLELLDEIPNNKGTVIFTAHGVSDVVIEKAKTKNLNIINATCTDVTNTFNLIKDRIKQGYEIIYIGKFNHPESMAAWELNKDKVHLIQSISDIKNLDIKTEKIVITNQTTLSIWDVALVADELKVQFPSSIYEREICDATQTRQSAVVDCSSDVDLIIIVGDPKSNNSNKLVEVSQKIGKTPAILIENVSDLVDFDFTHVNSVGVSAGASTPPLLVKDVFDFLEDNTNPKWRNYQINESKLIPKLGRK